MGFKISKIFSGIWHFIAFVFSGIAMFFSSVYTGVWKILSIIIKNVKVLVRSKSSALIVIFGPLLIVSLVGLAFNSSTIYDVKIAVYSDSYSDLSDNIIKDMQGDQYSVTKVESRDLCINGIKRGDFNICLIFSPDISVTSKKVNKITFYVDYTRVNLVYAIMDNIAAKLSKATDTLSLELTQNLVGRLEDTKDELAKRISAVASLNANNRNLHTRVTDINNKLVNINLTYNENDLKVDSAMAELNTAIKVASAKNYSLPELTTAQAKLEATGKKLNWIAYQINTAADEISKSTTDMLAVPAILDADKTNLDDLQASITKITAGIEGINITTAEDIVTPIQTDIQPIVTEKTYLGRLFPTFLVLVLMFVCIMLAVTLVMSEKDTNAYFRNFITPTSDFVFIIGTYLTCLLIVFVQLAIIMYVIRFFLEESIVSALTTSYLPLLLIVTMFIFIGMTIGYLFNSQETAILAALFIVSGSLFFSNTILPMETIAQYLKWILNLNPFVVSEAILKKILIFGFNLEDVLDLILNLVKFIIVAVVAVYVALKYYKKRLTH